MIEPQLVFEEQTNIVVLPDFSHTRFNGPDYVPALDDDRLRLQIDRVFAVMAFRKWRTLREIEAITGDPPASISAQLRHLRKEPNGSYRVEKRRRGHGKKGLFEYELLPKPKGVTVELDTTLLELKP